MLKGISETVFIFWHRCCLQILPKCVPNGSQNALSELWQTTLGPVWAHQRQRPTLSRRSFWPHMAPNLAPFPPSASCSHIITGAILLVNHNVNFYNGSSFSFTDRSIPASAASRLSFNSQCHRQTQTYTHTKSHSHTYYSSTSQLPWTHFNWRTCIWTHADNIC